MQCTINSPYFQIHEYITQESPHISTTYNLEVLTASEIEPKNYSALEANQLIEASYNEQQMNK